MSGIGRKCIAFISCYGPKAPATAPKIEKAELFEKSFDYNALIEDAVNNVNSISISSDSDLDLSMLGLEVRDVLKELNKNA